VASDAPLVIAPGIAVARQPMPGFAIPASNCYLIATENGALVVDPGLGLDDSAERWAAGLRAVGRLIADVEAVLLTHNHRDHAEGADALRELTGAPVHLHPDDSDFPATRTVTREALAGWGVPEPMWQQFLTRPIPRGVDADRELAHGLEFATAHGPLRAVHTPGHTAGHVCLALDEQRLLLTGDHVLPDQFPGAGVGGWFRANPLDVYERSLDAVGGYAGWTGHPGHGSPVVDLPGRAREIAEHHRRRTDEVGLIAASEPGGTVWQLAERVRWGGGFASLEAGRMLSALRQTAWHLERAQSAPEA
jgi:glyoxylase-like metal-dependent hydrolase (beta-lactamase superfamily II)